MDLSSLGIYSKHITLLIMLDNVLRTYRKGSNNDMARKKKQAQLSHYDDLVHVAGDVIWMDYDKLPGNVLGKVYKVKDGEYAPCDARLVYLAAKSKLIVE